jgi:hypothetical protein
VQIGFEALHAAAGQRVLLNEDFKLDLGFSEARSKEARKNFPAADGTFKSADDLAGDFLHRVVQIATTWFQHHQLESADGIYVAEPLAMNSDIVPKEWLENYRQKIRRILVGQRFHTTEFTFCQSRLRHINATDTAA